MHPDTAMAPTPVQDAEPVAAVHGPNRQRTSADRGHSIPDQRIIACDECGGDGGWEVSETGPFGHLYDPSNGALRTHWQRCPACASTGEIVVDVHPITFDDLDAQEIEQ